MLIKSVADQPTFLGKLQTLWDFTTVKLAVIAGILGAIGLAIPTWQHFDPTALTWVPAWFQHTCQACALLVTIGIVPARGTVQPGLQEKQTLRTAEAKAANPPSGPGG